MKNQPSVTIITLNHNGLQDTRECIKSVMKTLYSNFIQIVLDNGSLKNEVAILSGEFKDSRIKFVRIDKNIGFSEGNNAIIRKINSKYIVLLNNDTKVDPDWLNEFVNIAEKDETIAACQAKIRSMQKPNFFEYAGAAGGYIDRLGYPYARGRIGFFVEEDTGQYDTIVEIAWASGACMFLRKAALSNTELLPKDFFFYHEETDLCWQLRNNGYKIIFVPKAIVYHKGGATSKKNMQNRIFYVHRNNLHMIARNMPLIDLSWILPIRFCFEILSGFYYAIQKKPMFILALLQANIWFYTALPKIVYKRLTKKGKKTNNIKMEPFSIYWEYFVKKNKRYQDIKTLGVRI